MGIVLFVAIAFIAPTHQSLLKVSLVFLILLLISGPEEPLLSVTDPKQRKPQALPRPTPPLQLLASTNSTSKIAPLFQTRLFPRMALLALS